MSQVNDLAGRLLVIEQRIAAYEKLHTEELTELVQSLNECKREIAAILSSPRSIEQDAFSEPKEEDPSPNRDKALLITY